MSCLHNAKTIIVKRLIEGRKNATRAGDERRLCNHGCRENDALMLSNKLLLTYAKNKNGAQTKSCFLWGEGGVKNSSKNYFWKKINYENFSFNFGLTVILSYFS